MQAPGRSVAEERREPQRVPVTRPKGFSRCPRCAGLGPIVAISEGGLSFFFEGASLPDRKHVDIFFGNDLFCIRDVPCRKISVSRKNVAISAGDDRSVLIGHIEFGTLSPKQRAQLTHLINLLQEGEESCMDVGFSSGLGS